MFKSKTSRRFLLVAAVLTSLTIVACGGNTYKSQANSVTPALGASYNAEVYVYAADGITLLGQGKTGGINDANPGKAKLTLSGYTDGTPVIVKVVLDPANNASYYDENQPTQVAVKPASKFTMLSILPYATANQDFSANPLTNMAAKFAGVSADTLGTKALTSPLVADKVYEGLAKTNLVLGLPTSTNILVPVTPATKAVPEPRDTFSNLLVVMAKTPIGQISTQTTVDPIQRALDLTNAIKADGTIDTAKSTFTDLNAALKTKIIPGLSVGAAITTIDANTLAKAKTEVTTAVTKFTGSTTGGN
jgi:hypothetical protein